MSTKFLVSILLLVQSYNSVVLSSAIDDANAALNALRENVNNGISDSLKAYTVMAQEIDSTVEVTKTNAFGIISSTGDDYLAQYQAIKKSAEDSGLNVTNCVEIFEDKLMNLASVYINGLVDCVDTQVDGFIYNLEITFDILSGNILGDVFIFEQRVLKCRDDDCLSEATGEISRINAAITSQINNFLQREASDMQDYRATVDKCGVKFTSVADGQGKSYVSGFQDCVNSECSNRI
ncbi:hypothetical protein TcasGA2_TC007956 [Tribolium castaneum]|uniref:Protein TsetseEP domain-containing protein n=1 Tax=Tribolium castaneum TaxID=7070 RepID=D2A3C7_TRICA|nr:hypothetical protein TcasGA2_TC007956 [Tribolium castaneum]